MASNILSSSALFLAEARSAEPVQIISTPGAQHSYKSYQKPLKTVKSNVPTYKWDIVWTNVLIFFVLHSVSLYGAWLMITQAIWRTNIFFYLYGVFTGMGITAGAHRLWAHRTYRAKLPLRILLMFCQSGALQNHIYEWVRDHRVHHKFTDTDADPHNSRRGFFFSHIGWLMVKKHKDVFIKGKTVDLSDLEADPVVMFQRKYYLLLVPIFCFIIPVLIPWYFWNEDLWVSWYVVGIARYTLTLNFTWLVNSAAHIYGSKPYDNTISPTENMFVSWAAVGEGWHNYHHVFPWDYKAAELGNYRLNVTTAFLDFMAKIGWAYDLKTVSSEMVKKRVQRTGDGSWVDDSSSTSIINDIDYHHHLGDLLWGWGDKDMKEDDIRDIRYYNKLTE
ncbi:hypothetical protein NQ314_006660 [Rhamnusium bicolor]|uniref:Fatty acid desaturase domain-containing protein n=1 Tax=Rhamnusium bicolor TaxID=1586634 RepID=A0AAV8Z174_9CUCU|nr:hypothetical protein NQ314_006660 [Rhamnusium bicolor]